MTEVYTPIRLDLRTAAGRQAAARKLKGTAWVCLWVILRDVWEDTTRRWYRSDR